MKMDTFVAFIKHVYKGLVSESQLVQQISVGLIKAAKGCGGLGGANKSAWLLDTTRAYTVHPRCFESGLTLW
jgi:hypothetical protein